MRAYTLTFVNARRHTPPCHSHPACPARLGQPGGPGLGRVQALVLSLIASSRSSWPPLMTRGAKPGLWMPPCPSGVSGNAGGLGGSGSSGTESAFQPGA